MENKEYNKYTPVDVPNIPTENDVSAIIDQQGRQAADSFVPLSDPTVDLPTAQNVQPFEGDPVPFDLPGVSVKNHIVGSPDEQPGGYGVASDDDIINWIQTTKEMLVIHKESMLKLFYMMRVQRLIAFIKDMLLTVMISFLK